MEAATENRRPALLTAFLAGLQSGMVGALCMLGWLGVSAEWQQRNFWTAENLMASVFYGAGAIRSGFAWETLSGTALYLVLYSLLGGLFAVAVNNRMARRRTFLLAVVFAMAWYFLSFRLLWKSVMPLVALLHVEHSTALGHVIYGAILGRYPSNLPAGASPEPEVAPAGDPGHDAVRLPAEATQSPVQSSSPPDPASQSESF